MKKQYKEQILELLLKLEYIFLLFYICHVFFFNSFVALLMRFTVL